jgi:predicted N-acetyltransferase YhbS
MPFVEEVAEVNVTIREAQEADAVALAELLTELGYPSKISFARKHIRRSQAFHNQSVILVADHLKAVVGFVAMNRFEVLPYPYAWLRITAMCVTADHRHTGIGRALEASTRRMAASLDCSCIEVTSNIRRTDAHRFYKKLGYTEASKGYTKCIS